MCSIMMNIRHATYTWLRLLPFVAKDIKAMTDYYQLPSRSINRVAMIIHYSRKLYDVLVSWLSFYIKLPEAERYISGLEFAHDIVAKNFVDILIDYLRYFLHIKLPTASKIANVQEGLSSILVIFVAHISDVYLGLFKIIVLANVFYLIGLVLFTAAYMDSIDRKILFVALLFLALGISGGRDFLLESFLSDQHSRPNDPTVVEDEVDRVSWRPYIMLLLCTMVSFVLECVIPRKLFIIITIFAVSAGLLCFLSGHSFYRKRPPTGGPLGTTFLVFKAAILKRHLKYPTKPTQFHENERASNVLLPSIPFFRWLDRAAILESSSINKEELETNERLCTVAEVKEVKRLLTMIPMWTTFLIYSLVGAAGSTFFFEQSSSSNDRFPLVIFVICKELASLIASDMGKILTKLRFLKTRQRLATLVQIGIGMLCSLSCCIVAWRVEKFRLNTDENMNVLWLTPQFLLLGCMEGLAEEGLSEFFKTQVSGTMRDYGPAFNEFIFGIGKFISATLIVIFKDWFGEDVDSSHLDKYFEFLAWLSLLNFFLFVSTAVWYGNQQVDMKNLIPISIVLPNKSYSFPPHGSHLPKVRRFVTAIGNEKKL